MSERSGSSGHETEISDEQKRMLIDKARRLAPFAGQKVDPFGSYETRILYGDNAGYVSIYIPSLAGMEDEESFIDDAVRIIKRIPEDLDNGTTMVRMMAYTIHETDLTAEYSEDVKAFDTETAERVGPKPSDDIDAFMEAHRLELEFRVSPVFTEARLAEVNELLDSLDPDDTF